ncbi:MAG: hypothetical protein SH818_13190 [Saprospiraceae bacterium]|nr:hypothetical protein [Saprospiraceae bacterium]
MTALPIDLVSGLSLMLGISDILKAAYLVWFVYKIFKFFLGQLKWISAILFSILAFGTFTVWRLYGVPEQAKWV